MNTTDRANDIVGHGDDHVSENCLATGTRLAEFEITGVIGEGGFGIVYMTFDHSLRRPVAVKEYMPASIALRGQDGNVVVRARRHQPSFDTGLKKGFRELVGWCRYVDAPIGLASWRVSFRSARATAFARGASRTGRCAGLSCDVVHSGSFVSHARPSG